MLNTFYKNPTILPNTGLIYAKGFEKAEAYQTPLSSVVPIFDEDEDILYIKSTDSNGNCSMKMFSLTEEEIPRFDPRKYVSIEEFNSLKEDINNGFESIRKSIADAAISANQSDNRSNNASRISKANNEQH